MEPVAVLVLLSVTVAILAGLCVIGVSGAPARRQVAWLTLALGTAGMLLGLWIDGQRGGLLQLAEWCGRAGSALGWRELRLHWMQLPGMHIGMLLGGLCALPLMRIADSRARAWPLALACNLFCCVCMTVGMGMAVSLGSRLSGAGTSAMLLLMVGGMFAGMAVSRAAASAVDRAALRLDAALHRLRRQAGAILSPGDFD